MNNIEHIKLLFDEKKYNEALEFLNGVLKNNDLEQKNHIELLNLKHHVYEILNIKNTEMNNSLALKMIEMNEFTKALEILERINKEDKEVFTHKSLWQASVGAGDVSKSSLYGQEYLIYLYRLKRYQTILEFLEDYIKFGGSVDLEKEFKLRALIGLGDIIELDECFFKNDLKNFLDGKKQTKNLQQYELFLELTQNKRRYWKVSKNYYEVRILMSLINIDKNTNRSDFINDVFDRLIQYPEEKKWYQLLINYSLKFERKKLGLMSIEVLTKQKDKLNVKHGLSGKLRYLQENLEILPDIKEEVVMENSDMGLDLFTSEAKEETTFDKINKLERDIMFVRNSGNEASLEGLYRELIKLDENNDCLRDYYNSKWIKEASRAKLNRKTVKEIESDLLKEIEPFCLGEYENEDDKTSLIRGCKKYLELIDKEDFRINMKDYYMAFYWMGLYEICCFAIDKYLNLYVNIPLDRYLSLIYLKIVALIELESFYLASDLCEELIFNKPMMDDEKINIMYLLGEVSVKLNRKDKAHEAFSWVIKVNPKYRLAKMRLKNIEQGQ
ncbi:MAG: hypothetical protein HN576_02190 [Bacteriovoracaceae bacterium]|jgi:hypothetical protein|nr:hypothetical protein [Bacteriovoracaceae bacterium]